MSLKEWHVEPLGSFRSIRLDVKKEKSESPESALIVKLIDAKRLQQRRRP